MMGALRMPIQIDTSKKGAIAQFIKDKVEEGATLYLPSSIFTIYAFNELKDVIKKSNKVKFLFNKPTFIKKIRTD
jgi:DeoR/GlpR family transcriptional regulator of sugar metabolism